MTQFLFFDTETTGINHYTDRIVQLAWMLTDQYGATITQVSHIIKPNGFSIPKSASRIHGITTEMAMQKGILLDAALAEFSRSAASCEAIVGHNLAFDMKMLRPELARTNIVCAIDGKSEFCTMRLATNWCGISKSGRSGHYKWPKLEELHDKLFSHSFENAHDALADVQATKRCFFALIEKGVIKMPDKLNWNTDPE